MGKFTFVKAGAATGTILGPGIEAFTIEGKTVAAVGDAIAPHGTGAHAAATLVVAVPGWSTYGKSPALNGAAASCGCTVTAELDYG